MKGSWWRNSFWWACLWLLAPLGTRAGLTTEGLHWPLLLRTNRLEVKVYQPVWTAWDTNRLSGRAAVEFTTPGLPKPILGIITFQARARVNEENRQVILDGFEVTESRWPAIAPERQRLEVLSRFLAGPSRTVAWDRLKAELAWSRIQLRKAAPHLSHRVPQIFYATNEAALVRIDGSPVFSEIENTQLKRVLNTPVLLVQDSVSGKYYLDTDGWWLEAPEWRGPWLLSGNAPTDVRRLKPELVSAPGPSDPGLGPVPEIFVTTEPVELLRTDGPPQYRPIPGTSLLYVTNTDSLLFYDEGTREAYGVLSGRWFKSKSLAGPWQYVAPEALPPDFGRIPPNHPKAAVLVSVPGTRGARLALVANSIPVTTLIRRGSVPFEFTYDGTPEFEPVPGTALEYAVNASAAIIRDGARYFGNQAGIWFVADRPTGPWEVAEALPAEIYSIPPESPLYYLTYSFAYPEGSEEVEVGYTPGYLGSYEDNGTVVYGTGYSYPGWTGAAWYGWGWTWGYGCAYNLWRHHWAWRPIWPRSDHRRIMNPPNLYGLWRRYGVRPRPYLDLAPLAPLAPLVSPAPPAPLAPRAELAWGHPTCYGRFVGAKRPAPLPPPPGAHFENSDGPVPMIRTVPSPRNRAGSAVSVSRVPFSPGNGLVMPDGRRYWQHQGGWYRREAAGNWSYVGPSSMAAGVYDPTKSPIYRPSRESVYRPGSSRVHIPPPLNYFRPRFPHPRPPAAAPAPPLPSRSGIYRPEGR
jgi:hypothetical protein